MKITCEECDARVPAKDVDLPTQTAKCRRCDAVFSIAAHLGKGRRPRRRVPLPKGLEVVAGEPHDPTEGYREPQRPAERGELVITRRWRSWLVVPMAVFAVIWNGFMLFWYGTALSTGAHEMAVFGVLHLGIGVFVGYRVIAELFNVSTIRVADGRLIVSHGPIPWPGRHDLPTSSLGQLYTVRRVRRSKNGRSVQWEVHALSHDHEAIKLLTGLKDREQAEYIEWCVEQHLGIVDDPTQNVV